MRDDAMTDEVRNILLGIGVMAILLVASCALRAQDRKTPRYYDEQLLNYRYSEVCSTPLPKGDALPSALNEALKQDAKTWLPWVLWWNETVEKYKKARCNDA